MGRIPRLQEGIAWFWSAPAAGRRASAVSVVDASRSSAASRPARAGRAWSAGPARWPAPARRARRRASAARLARGDALGRLLVQLLRHRRRAAHARSGRAPAPRARSRRAPWRRPTRSPTCTSRDALGGLAVDLHPALVDLVGRQRARLVEARGPQPLVEAHARSIGCRSWSSIVRQRQAHDRRPGPSTRPSLFAVVQRDAAAQRLHDLVADRQAQAGAAARVAGGEGLEQALAQLGGDARAAVGDASARRVRRRAASRTASAPPRGRVLDGVVQQVARQLAQHPFVRAHRRGAVSMLEVELACRRSAATGRAPPRARPRPSRAPARRPAGATARPWPATASGWPARWRARPCCSISCSACAGSTSPRCADCTCVFSTASGVRSWCAVSRTKRFWWSSRCARRAITWLVASTSGSSSRGASRRVDRRQVVLGARLRVAALSSRTGRVARCTTTTTTSGDHRQQQRPGATACRSGSGAPASARSSSVSATWIVGHAAAVGAGHRLQQHGHAHRLRRGSRSS